MNLQIDRLKNCFESSASRYFVIFWLLTLIVLNVNAQMQPFLLLEKPGTGKRIRYFVGDEIVFKMHTRDAFMTGYISQLSDSAFFIGRSHIRIPIDSVEALADRSKVKSVRSLSHAAFGAIPVFFVLSAGQNLFNTGRRPIIDPEVWWLSGAFATLGLAGYLYKGRRYRLENRWRLLVVDHRS